MTSVTPPPRTLSVPVASPLLAALLRLAAMPFCVANKLGVACAWFVPCAAVPWNLYGLKIPETQSASNRIVLHFSYGLSVLQSPAWINEPTIEPHGLLEGRGNRHCFYEIRC